MKYILLGILSIIVISFIMIKIMDLIENQVYTIKPKSKLRLLILHYKDNSEYFIQKKFIFWVNIKKYNNQKEVDEFLNKIDKSKLINKEIIKF